MKNKTNNIIYGKIISTLPDSNYQIGSLGVRLDDSRQVLVSEGLTPLDKLRSSDELVNCIVELSFNKATRSGFKGLRINKIENKEFKKC